MSPESGDLTTTSNLTKVNQGRGQLQEVLTLLFVGLLNTLKTYIKSQISLNPLPDLSI